MFRRAPEPDRPAKVENSHTDERHAETGVYTPIAMTPDAVQTAISRLRANISKVYIGNADAVDRLIRCLLARGHRNLRAVDIKPIGEWYQVFREADNRVLDLKSLANCRTAVAGVSLSNCVRGDVP